MRERIAREFPAGVHEVLTLGVDRLIDYQDPAYAALYLDRLAPIRDLDAAHGGGTHHLLAETARHLALGMAYEDTIRVAELKIRASRFERVRREVKAADAQVLRIAEFMHPRVEEIADTLPAAAGRRLLATPWARGLVGRFTRKGRVVRTSTISGFLLLAAVASRKPKRRATLRFAAEDAHLTRWLDRVAATAAQDYALACELAECLTLVKGYGDTHARGHRNFEVLMGMLPALSVRSDGAAVLAGLRNAALADETGAALAQAVAALEAGSAAPGGALYNRAP